MPQIPKYSKLEIERRWLVDHDKIGELQELNARQIRDKYISNTLTRLRRITSKHQTVYKLCKKYGFENRIYQPVTNLYLSEEEYTVFNALNGVVVEKTRYSLHEGGLDIYRREGMAFEVYEVEFSSIADAENYSPPNFITEEITNQARYRGIDFAV